MPSIFSHAIFASALGKASLSEPLPLRFWVLTALCSVLPDADVIGFPLGISYGSMFGHRGITHSIAFSIFVGIIVGAFCRSRIRSFSFSGLVLYFTSVTFSHPLLDMLTNGGLGVALFASLSTRRYFLPWRPIAVSPIGVGFFSQRGLDVLASEIIWVWLPALGIMGAALVYRKVIGGGRRRDDPQGYA